MVSDDSLALVNQSALFFPHWVFDWTREDECYQLTEQSTSYVEGAQKHLERAIENRNSYRFYVVCWFLGSAIFLLVFDYIDSRWSLI